MNLPSQNDNLSQDLAKEAKLRYVSDSNPGFLRKRIGKNFIYLNTSGEKIHDEKILQRISSLGIPPAWTDVWICTLPNGHIQATGFDEKGRKQYRYHPEWIALSQEKKFEKLLFFSRVLPELRAKVEADLKRSGLPRQKVLATIIWLLDNTYIRVGNDEYAKENRHYGLTTLHNRHVSIAGSNVTFEFIGKSGKSHRINIHDRRAANIIRKLEELPGYELFQYINDEGERHGVDSAEVNKYLQSITGDSISAKDFRTWGGTVLSATTLHNLGDFETEKEARKKVTQAVSVVASTLRNTAAVCKNYYIHPVVPSAYQGKKLIPLFSSLEKYLNEKPELLDRNEYAVSLLLRRYT